jgi:hypothetical protein
VRISRIVPGGFTIGDVVVLPSGELATVCGSIQGRVSLAYHQRWQRGSGRPERVDLSAAYLRRATQFEIEAGAANVRQIPVPTSCQTA